MSRASQSRAQARQKGRWVPNQILPNGDIGSNSSFNLVSQMKDTAAQQLTATMLADFLRAPTLRRMRGRACFAAAVAQETEQLKLAQARQPAKTIADLLPYRLLRWR